MQSQNGLRGAIQFKIFKDGANPDTAPPFDTVTTRKEKGKAERVWCPTQPDKKAEESEMKFFFQAWAFGCDKVKSGNLTVEKEVPEFRELKWELAEYDEEGNESSREEVSEIEHGLTAILSAKAEKMEDGEFATINVYEEGYEDPDDFRARRLAEVKDGMVQTEWQVKEKRERLEELEEDDELKYVFAVEAAEYEDCRSEDSAAVQVVFCMYVDIMVEPARLSESDKYILKSTDDSYSKEITVTNDNIPGDQKVTIKFEDLLPGKNIH